MANVRTFSRHYPRRDEVAAQAIAVLEAYKGLLSPEQSDFTYDDGRVEMLLSLTGVLPIPFGRGAGPQTTYHCPVAFWLPLDFPSRPPIVLVQPTKELGIRKTRNVDPNGRVLCPYLENWARKAEGCNLTTLIEELIPLFSQKYPLQASKPPPPTSSPAPAASSSSASPAQPPPRPPPPPQAGSSSSAANSSAQLPPRPPMPPPVGAAGVRPGSLVMDSPGTVAGPALGGGGGGGLPPRPPLPPGPPGPPPAYPAQPPAPPPLPSNPQRSSTLAYPPQPPPPQPPFLPPGASTLPPGFTPPLGPPRLPFSPAGASAASSSPAPPGPPLPPQAPAPYGSPAFSSPPPPQPPQQPPTPPTFSPPTPLPAHPPFPPAGAEARPVSPTQSTVRSFSPAPSSVAGGPPRPPPGQADYLHHGRQGSLESVQSSRARPPPPAVQQQHARAYSPTPSEASPYHPHPPHPPPHRFQHQPHPSHSSSHHSQPSYDAPTPPTFRSPRQQPAQPPQPPPAHFAQTHPRYTPSERSFASPPPSEAGSYAPSTGVRGPRPPQPPSQPGRAESVYSATDAATAAEAEYGSYLPPSVGGPELPLPGAGDLRRSQTASYRPMQRSGAGYAAYEGVEEGGSAFEPVVEAAQRGARPRQESLESGYSAYSAPYGYQPQPPPPPRTNGHGGGYGSADYGSASYGSPHAHLPPAVPLVHPGPPTPPQPPRAARKPKPAAPRTAVAALNILDAADDDASAPSSPSFVAPSLASGGGGQQQPPPVPPNPALLALRTRVHSKLSSSLTQLSHSVAQELHQLDLMRVDLEKAQPAIEDEMARLEAVRSVCAGVRDRYEAVVGEGERRLREYEVKGEGVEVDEIVCGSTVVYVQLLDLVAEDAALEDTLYALGRGLNSGGEANIDLDRFLRTARRLAKEQFVIRATINKILLGLAIRRERSSAARAGGGESSQGGSGRGTPAVSSAE
ncbi:hypothetical protein JCM8097_003645 [Rhodosporidiobolus ruineniae]